MTYPKHKILINLEMQKNKRDVKTWAAWGETLRQWRVYHHIFVPSLSRPTCRNYPPSIKKFSELHLVVTYLWLGRPGFAVKLLWSLPMSSTPRDQIVTTCFISSFAFIGIFSNSEVVDWKLWNLDGESTAVSAFGRLSQGWSFRFRAEGITSLSTYPRIWMANIVLSIC